MHGEAAGHLQSKKPSPPLGLKRHCLGNGFLQPRECWGRAEVPQQELWQDRNSACARKQTGRAGAHSGRCVCVNRHLGFSSLACLSPAHAYHWPNPTRRETSGEPQACNLVSQPPGHWAGQRRVVTTSGRIQTIFSTGAYLSTPSVSVYRR